MLGYTCEKNNDVFVFLEGKEINRLEKEVIEGTYFNIKEEKCLLRLSIDEDKALMEGATHEYNKNDEGIVRECYVWIQNWTYERLKRNRKLDVHRGFCHIKLFDITKLNDFFLKRNYSYLKSLLE